MTKGWFRATRLLPRDCIISRFRSDHPSPTCRYKETQMTPPLITESTHPITTLPGDPSGERSQVPSSLMCEKMLGFGTMRATPAETPPNSVLTAGAPKDCQPSPEIVCDLSTNSGARRWVSASPIILVVLVSEGLGFKIDALTSFKSSVAWGHPELVRNINSVRYAA